MVTAMLSDLLLLGIGILAALVAFFVMQFLHLVVVMAWCDARTKGADYYGRSREERSHFKKVLRRHRFALAPILRLLGRCRRFRFEDSYFSVGGVAGPKGTCTQEDFQRALQYQPQSDDILVASQMKCGTTWMQHLVLQVLTRGEENLAESGTTLYAVSPWLESSKTVCLDAAPRVGVDRRWHIIKTHFPTSLCPYSPEAKYVYVARHPVSCFASCVDFIRSNLPEFAPSLEACEAWYRSSKLMWWGTWPAHVAGWWAWAEQRDNVLFVRFEDMRRDLSAVARQVATFLEVEALTDSELASIIRKCSFDYMRDNADSFEMHPPHLLQTRGKFFVSGKTSRYRDIPEDVAARISQWCHQELAASGVPVEDLFRDLAGDPEVAA
jgi:hypothetical protein